MARPWQSLNAKYSARYYQNGRTDVKRADTGEIVTSYSPSLQDDLRRGCLDGPLSYLFGKES